MPSHKEVLTAIAHSIFEANALATKVLRPVDYTIPADRVWIFQNQETDIDDQMTCFYHRMTEVSL